MQEANWFEVKYVPSFDEYIENTSVSIALGTIVFISAFFLRGDSYRWCTLKNWSWVKLTKTLGIDKAFGERHQNLSGT